MINILIIFMEINILLIKILNLFKDSLQITNLKKNKYHHRLL
jgi:hypothetical protein